MALIQVVDEINSVQAVVDADAADELGATWRSRLDLDRAHNRPGILDADGYGSCDATVAFARDPAKRVKIIVQAEAFPAIDKLFAKGLADQAPDGAVLGVDFNPDLAVCEDVALDQDVP